MSFLKADDDTLLKELAIFLDPVEITDANGKLLGIFVPANLERARQRHAEMAAKTDWAEINRRAEMASKSPEKGLTTKEIFERFLSLTTDPAVQADLQKKIKALEELDRCPTP
jgi:hypothetical protein